MKRITMIAAFAASCLAVPASAQDVGSSVVVAHDDLDLAKSSDVSRLDLRIAHAANEACGSVSSIDLEGMVRKPRCERDAVVAVRPMRDRLIAQAESAPGAQVAPR